MVSALVLIDIQNFYFGDNTLEGIDHACRNARKLLDRFRLKNGIIVHVKHEFDNDKVWPQGKNAEDIHPLLYPIADEKIIAKRSPGAFTGTNLHEELKSRDVDSLVICGMLGHMCVDTTTREGHALGLKCTVIHDACTTQGLKVSRQGGSCHSSPCR
ncbi:MAG: isochorismatase family protein [bacterium]|nr:isochorismatase family protein [bacterium]